MEGQGITGTLHWRSLELTLFDRTIDLQ